MPEPSHGWAWRGRALVALIALAALTPLLSVDRAAAETHGIACINGQWVHTVNGGFSGYPGARSGIPCDEPKPGWIFDLNDPGRIVWVYDGDRVPTPYTNPGSNVVHVAIREVQAQGNTRPLVNQPVDDSSTAFTYPGDGNNRAVRGDDGECYRERRVGRRWLRSSSYGSDAEACRQASWNAYNRAVGLPLVVGGGTFPNGNPPVIGPPVTGGATTLVSNIAQAESGGGVIGLDHAQAFTTGSHLGGYKLTGVSIAVRGNINVAAGTNWEVAIWSASGSNPGERLHALTKPASFSPGLNLFSAPGSGIDLAANTAYWVVVDTSSSADGIHVSNTGSNAEDHGASQGWTIANDSRWKSAEQQDWNWFGEKRRLAIHGYAAR